MVDLDEEVLARPVVVKQIPGDPRPLGHPVEPDAPRRAENVVVADLGVDGSVEFYASI